jgi:hypothetical protein
MQMIFEFALMVSASLLSLMAGYMIAKQLPNLTKPAAVIGFLLLCLSVLPGLFPAYFYFLFPSHFALEVLLAIAFLFSGVLMAGYSDTGFRKIIQGILAPLMVYFILFPSGYLAFHSDYIKSLDYEVRDGVTIQSSYFGCVPSSISTILRHYGLEYTEGELAYALHTTTMGTDLGRPN